MKKSPHGVKVVVPALLLIYISPADTVIYLLYVVMLCAASLCDCKFVCVRARMYLFYFVVVVVVLELHLSLNYTAHLAC